MVRFFVILIFALFGGFASLKAISLGADPRYFTIIWIVLGICAILRWVNGSTRREMQNEDSIYW